MRIASLCTVLGFCGCAAPSAVTLQTARTAKAGAVRFQLETEIVTAPDGTEPDRPERPDPAPEQGATTTSGTFAASDIAVGLPLGLELQLGLSLFPPGGAAGIKWQLIGDTSSTFALALQGTGRISGFENGGVGLGLSQRAGDLLATLALTSSIDLTLAARFARTTVMLGESAPTTEAMPIQLESVREYEAEFDEYGGALGLELRVQGEPDLSNPDEVEWVGVRFELSILRWVPTRSLSTTAPGWTVGVGLALVSSVVGASANARRPRMVATTPSPDAPPRPAPRRGAPPQQEGPRTAPKADHRPAG